MSMLLTLSQSIHGDLGGGKDSSTHDFSAKFNHLRFRASPLSKVDRQLTATPPTKRDISLEEETSMPAMVDMATPHRGLPPPSAMQLPEPNRPQLQPVHSAFSSAQNSGGMPAPPNHWQGQEESMRNWLHAKAEEDRRKQEEEKTRQETLKLEQRRIEQNMLRESLQGGVPPQMIPIIYAGMGGGALVQLSAEWLHQYATQLQFAQQQQQQPSDPRSQRMIGEAPYPYPPATQASYTAEPATAPVGAQPYSAYPRTAVTSAPRSLAQASLPRLTTNDVYTAPPPVQNPGSAHPLQQSQTHGQDAPASSPLIYFHHWVPPGGDASKAPQTPATERKIRHDEPTSARPGSQLSDGESRDSPRKRKAQGEHRANPPPTSAPQYGSPSFSTASSVSTKRLSGHSRNRSTTSFKEESRPDSRKEEHRFSFVPVAVQEEDVRRLDRVSERREEATAAGANVRQHGSRLQSPQPVPSDEQRPRSHPEQQPLADRDHRGPGSVNK